MTTAPAIEWSADQERALSYLRGWRDLLDQQYVTLGGLAGTGKSSLIAALAEEWPKTAVCALAGKAAYVLRQKGVQSAQTIHSLIYDTVMEKDRKGKTRPHFVLKLGLTDVQTIIVDEASMVDRRLFNDLLTFGLPVLFVGDHGQLEPIGPNPNLMLNPDVKLETIHRQEKDNPIIRLAHAFREGRKTPKYQCPDGKLQMLPRKAFWDELRHYRQCIVGFNKTRHEVNKLVRNSLGDLGHRAESPVREGERLICLKNDKRWTLFNGQQVTVVEVIPQNCTKDTMEVVIETDEGIRAIDILTAQLGADLITEIPSGRDYKRTRQAALMDYGYAITAHKSQGSEWSDVLVLEEVSPKWDVKRWRYTTCTRASERLIYCS